MSPWWLHSIYFSSPLLCKMSSLTQNMLFSYKNTPISNLPVFNREIFLYLILCSQSPACAGKTQTRIGSFVLLQDHPRVCGKNFQWTTKVKRYLGSPPRVREKRLSVTSFNSSVRITPACAGKTRAEALLEVVSQDHPRVCRKNSSRIPITTHDWGSPPHMREKLKSYWIPYPHIRITPACAGKTSMPSYWKRLSWDHPRMCGKNSYG